MKLTIKLIICVAVIILASACMLFTESTLRIVNNSEFKLDSVLISINGSPHQKEYLIEPRSQKTFKIKTENVKFNSHDVSIVVDLYSMGEKVGFSTDYTDLGGNLDPEYEIVFAKKGERAIMRSRTHYSDY